MENFITYLRDNGSFSEAELPQILQACQTKKLRRKQYLLQQGEVWKYNCFVMSGCLRTYSVDEKGNEHIIRFAIENWWAGDRASYEFQKPSEYFIDALEASEVILILRENFEQLRKTIPALNDLVNGLLHRSFIVSQERIHTAISASAEEKYRRFLQQYPQLILRVPQHMIASYLGITKETLSRIRKASAKEL